MEWAKSMVKKIFLMNLTTMNIILIVNIYYIVYTNNGLKTKIAAGLELLS